MPEVKRNDVLLNFTRTEVKKGKNAGTAFYATDEKAYNILSAWIGEEQAASMLSALLRLRSKGWSAEAEKEAKNEDGSLNTVKYDEVFTAMAQDFSARGESIKELEGQIAELVDELTNLDYTIPSAIPRAQELAGEIKKLQIAIQSKRRTRAEEEAETTVPA